MKDKRTLNILLADDDEDDRMIFTEIVAQLDEPIHLRTVADGQQLLRLLSDKTFLLPDVIFLDLNMPNKNGKECLREIKTNPSLHHLPVIIYSTSAAEKDIRDTFRQGASLYIQKPSNIRGLKKTLSQVLSIDWHDGPSPVDEDNFLVKLSWLDQLFATGAGSLHYLTGRPGPSPAFSIVWPKNPPQPQFL